MRTPRSALLAVAAAAVLVAACGDDGPAAGTPTAPTTAGETTATSGSTDDRHGRRHRRTGIHRRTDHDSRSGHCARRPDVRVDGSRGLRARRGDAGRDDVRRAEPRCHGRLQPARLGLVAGGRRPRRAGDGDDADGLHAGHADGPGHVAVGGAHVATDGCARRQHADAHGPGSGGDAGGPRGRQPGPPAGRHDVERRGADLRRRRVVGARRWPGSQPGARGRFGRARHRAATAGPAATSSATAPSRSERSPRRGRPARIRRPRRPSRSCWPHSPGRPPTRSRPTS